MVMFAIHLAQYRNITGLIVDNGHDRRKSDDRIRLHTYCPDQFGCPCASVRQMDSTMAIVDRQRKLDTYSRSNRAIVSAGSFDSNNLLSAHGQDEPQPGILQQYRVCQGATIIRGQDIRRLGYRFRSKTGHDTECRTDKIASRNFYL